jgi:hypothetical protein
MKVCIKRVVALVSVVGVSLILQGCTPPPPLEPKRIDEIRPVPPLLKITTFTIQRNDFRNAIVKGPDNAIRLVPVYESVASRGSFENRIFEIRPGSVYALLGLENRDILVAANGFLVKQPDIFTRFIELLAQENEATIEIRRNGEPRLLKYVFVPAIPKVK